MSNITIISGGLWWPGLIVEVSRCKLHWNGQIMAQ